MSKTFLSIDLDYWATTRPSYTPQKASSRFINRKPYIDCNKFFDCVFSLKVPFVFVKHHHTLLKTINRIDRLDTIVNVDYHSDIGDVNIDEEDHPLCPGTWGNFVTCRKQGTFQWFYPYKECTNSFADGLCQRNPDCPDTNPFKYPQLAGWKNTQKSTDIEDVPWHNVVAVGICLSPDYSKDIDKIKAPLQKIGRWEWSLRALDEEYRGYGNSKYPSWSNNHKTYRVSPEGVR